jgi:hypothetical protein
MGHAVLAALLLAGTPGCLEMVGSQQDPEGALMGQVPGMGARDLDDARVILTRRDAPTCAP